ncbi:hypothetical protein JOM56_011670 [Amanita muscaria]
MALPSIQDVHITPQTPRLPASSSYFSLRTKLLSGTSMAAPHVSGLLAYLLGLYGDVSEDLIVQLQPQIAAGTANFLVQNIY